uniref:hypothetical protein n=1 Tax=Pseudomonas amygdali TaxID=47877 RepID=UPI002880A4E3
EREERWCMTAILRLKQHPRIFNRKNPRKANNFSLWLLLYVQISINFRVRISNLSSNRPCTASP